MWTIKDIFLGENTMGCFVFWRGSFLDFVLSSMYFPYFVIISPLKKGGLFIWTNLNLHHLKGSLCLGWFWRRRFSNFVIGFFTCLLFFSSEKEGGFIWINLNPYHPRMFFRMLTWNGSGGPAQRFLSKIFITISF